MDAVGLTTDWFVEHFPDVDISTMQLAACRYLERKGLRFTIDFGYENAQSMVWGLIDPEGMSLEYSDRLLDEYKTILFGSVEEAGRLLR